jgi:hypothetical protein
MIELVTSVTVATVLSLGAAAPRPAISSSLAPVAAAAATAFPSFSPAGPNSALPAQMLAEKDSRKNGAIIGAIAGGVAGALAGSIGCGIVHGLDEMWGGPQTSSNCTGPAIIAAAIGTGLGAAIGAGIDALFEQAPYPAAGASGRRKGVRLRWRF